MSAMVLLMSSILFLAALSIWIWTRKQIESFKKLLSEQSGSVPLIDELSALNAGSIGMGGRFLKLERDLQACTRHIDELQSQIHNNSPYAQAILMAQRGSSLKDIIEVCGLSVNEAQLLIMLHQKSRAA
ncbi:MAG: DUF2802 domain-containing protein [Gammaproteobacteria bacterium]|nr:DUF2802 domain-containing protein [Gammaproteobacteria bacterium]